MKTKVLLFNHWLRVYEKCFRKFNQLRLTNRNKKRQGRLAMTIRRLHKKLSNLQVSFQRGAMTSAAVFALAFTSQNSSAQNFHSPLSDPFGIVNLGQYRVADFADMDGDGDLDIMSGVYYGDFYYYQNIGSKTSPAFSDPQVNPFGLVSTGLYNYPTVADLDVDGDLDILSVSFDGEFIYYKNTGTANQPVFEEPETSPFGLYPLGTLFFPNLADLDNDGDLDIMAGLVFNGKYVYFENTGNPQTPVFGTGQPSPFGLPDVAETSNAAFADLDKDGDLDLMTGSYEEFLYFQNIGSASTPAFDTPQSNPFHLVHEGIINLPFFGDLDEDGDTDMMSVEIYGTTYYYENDTCTSVLSIEAGKDLGEILFPNPNLGKFKIDITQNANVEIFDAVGKIVYAKRLNAGTEQIDISPFGDGMFIAKINYDDHQVLHQVIVQR